MAQRGAVAIKTTMHTKSGPHIRVAWQDPKFLPELAHVLPSLGAVAIKTQAQQFTALMQKAAAAQLSVPGPAIQSPHACGAAAQQRAVHRCSPLLGKRIHKTALLGRANAICCWTNGASHQYRFLILQACPQERLYTTALQEVYEGCAQDFKDQFYHLRSQCQQLQYAMSPPGA
eukprot:scaffold199475_cov15-Tisochrysis_lutea.AAC.1